MEHAKPGERKPLLHIYPKASTIGILDGIALQAELPSYCWMFPSTLFIHLMPVTSLVRRKEHFPLYFQRCPKQEALPTVLLWTTCHLANDYNPIDGVAEAA